MNTMEKPASVHAGNKRFRFLRRFVKDERGSNALEFTMLIFPFTLMMFAVIESGISFAAQQIMSNAADDVARGLRVNTLIPSIRPDGSTPTPPEIAAKVKEMICDEISVLVTAGCPGLAIDLRTYAKFEDVPVLLGRKSDGDIELTGFHIVPGGAGDINSIRVAYRWPVIADFMRKYLAELPDGKTLLFSTLTWRNEPYES